MGNVIVKFLLANLSQRVVVMLLITVLERVQASALATATPVDDAIVGAVLDVLRRVDAEASPIGDATVGAVLDGLRRVDAEAGQ